MKNEFAYHTPTSHSHAYNLHIQIPKFSTQLTHYEDQKTQTLKQQRSFTNFFFSQLKPTSKGQFNSEINSIQIFFSSIVQLKPFRVFQLYSYSYSKLDELKIQFDG
jgi:hypothetical protein